MTLKTVTISSAISTAGVTPSTQTCACTSKPEYFHVVLFIMLYKVVLTFKSG